MARGEPQGKLLNTTQCLKLVVLYLLQNPHITKDVPYPQRQRRPNMIADSSSSSTKSCGWDTNCDGRMSGNESQRQINDAAKRLQGYGK